MQADTLELAPGEQRDDGVAAFVRDRDETARQVPRVGVQDDGQRDERGEQDDP
ncbi:hypothetical protein GCM10009677_13540 [Sphaerisporangium rubeum]|uniref:Uncharacterized protein n=1 Tax=Sphaerisporangium rubeum TaxID=321317 RepID=A0A7X0IDH7_9ACTN|nr:hypothetical protein [Sphaerisporangium rubeum]